MSEVIWTELEKIDVLRERMGVSYERARVSLETNQGDLIKALAELEKEQSKAEDGFAGRFYGGVKEQMKRLNKTQLNLKHVDKTVLSISAPLGMALAYAIWKRPTLRMFGLVGAATAAINNYELEVDTRANQDEEWDDEYPYDIHTEIIPDDDVLK
ncbi:DUF4342 domain-containing protein [Desulfitobacterium sp. AusDCA]|uniref:DUF4342 domain-containing protein n=1 Tax=Desulfitobacterium sp. AusDCA TaxID=3240383 RepID=UPI003DA7262F